MKQNTIRTLMLATPQTTLTDPCLVEARAIGDRLCEGAVHHRGTCNWMGRALPDDPRRGLSQPAARSLSYPLFEGAAGIALFLARLGSVTGEAKYRKTALAGMRCALDLARDEMERCEAGENVDNRFGPYSGILSTIWAAKEVAAAFDDITIRQHAMSLLERLAQTTDAPAAEDVILGYAGALPCLLDLDRAGFPGAKALAVKLGDLLMARAERVEGTASWPKRFPDWSANLTGFSHGAGGIAWALACLHQATGDERSRAMALEAFEYERRVFREDEGNWPDFRGQPDATGKHHCTTYWCHGAPGLGVARALAHPMLGDARLLEEAYIAHETTLTSIESMLKNPGTNVQMCHGVFGNLEALWIMEDAFGVPGASERARIVATHFAAIYGKDAHAKWGRFVDWPTGMPGTNDLALMKGLAGVGHFLLRCHAPEKVPPLLVPGTAAQK